jgi:hypothetical protein
MMMALPMTLNEAKARQWGRNYLVRMKEGPFELGNGGKLNSAPLDPACGYGFAKLWFKLVGQLHPLNMSHVAELATVHREPAAHDALIEMIAEREERGEPLGSVLAAYSIRLKHTPFAPHGGWSRTRFVEDLVLFLLILGLRERFCFKPTRYLPAKANSKPSACSIAAALAAEAGLGRGAEGAFHQIWKKFKPSLLPGYRWQDWGRGLD